MSIFGEFEKAHAAEMRPQLNLYQVERAAWEEEIKGFRLAIRNNAKNGEPTDAPTMALEAAMANEPIAPKLPKYILTDATPEGIIKSLLGRWKSSGLMSDDAVIIFDSRAMHKQGMFNKLWDGDVLHIDRAISGSFTLFGARFTILLHVQPKTFQKFLTRQGDLARDNGFLARCLASRPVSTQGWRPIDGIPPSWSNLEIFKGRVLEILKMGLDEDELPSIVLKFSHEAQAIWTEFHNRVEHELRDGGYLCDIRDGASKIAENAARMAALFHFFEGRTGDIQAETMSQARDVCGWYLEEFKKLFGAVPETPIEILDANDLGEYFHKVCIRYPGTSRIPKNVIAQMGPSHLRKSKLRREAGLYVLASSDHIRLYKDSKTQWVEFNPSIFPVYAGHTASPYGPRI
jgi:putative DNA primase/helicase